MDHLNDDLDDDFNEIKYDFDTDFVIIKKI